LQQRHEKLVAYFDERVAPFWSAVDFTPHSLTGTDRLRGVWERP